ncbi:MAG: UvrD-helicase domain-containing protein, partial [Nitriliruptoraceae bacterium]|nr:UvrD-helicase domain-containing protein [Nitriliruptoraceae bacterium]
MSGSEPGADVLPTPRARPFEVGGPLPLGTTVLDASAGTGKTFAIAALVTRYVAELGIDLGEILVVTFTRAATAELRGRIRQRLVGARDHLAGVLDGRSAATEDPVLDALADADADELARRHRRLVEALDGIDRAQIATIHGWCQQVLGGLGLAVDLPDELTVLEDETALVEQVTRDLLIERFTDRPGAPGLTDVLDAVEAACRTPDAPLVPTEEPHEDDRADQGDDEATGRLIAWVARDARHRLAARKRRLGVVGHQDLLDVLRATLRAGTTGRRAVETLRTRTRIALIDEFQDTDPVQWDILQTLFRGAADPADPRALVLIGDPKQAIYRFRGADVGAYLAATRQATDRRTLTTNWRSDEALLAALDRLLAGSVYGETGIEHVPVDAAPGHEGSRLRGEPDACQPLVLRAVLHEGPDARPPTATSARTGLIVDDVVAQTARLLAPGTLQIPGTEGHRDLRPGDVAVLVRSNHDALVVQRALIDHGIAAVLNSVGSVFATDAAAAWADLLEALLRPSDAAAVRRVAAGPFLATDPAALIDAEEPLVDALHETIHHWGELARERGIPAVHHAISETTGLTARLLSHLGGERTLTDLEHVGALRHAGQRPPGPGAPRPRGRLGARLPGADAPD